jgi:RNA polymerase sigma-70 factor (ECF subfamily)
MDGRRGACSPLARCGSRPATLARRASGRAALTDDELIERAKRGDVAAYEGLVRRYETLAVRTAFAAGGSEADAEDAAQEAFMKAYAALARFRPGAPFRPWLLRIVANEARNRQRSAGRRAAVALRVTPAAGSDDDVPSPEQTVLADERRTALLAAVGRLREDDREVLLLRYFVDLDEAEMAAALGTRRGTVKSRLSRALGRLRVVIAEGDAAASAMTSDADA